MSLQKDRGGLSRGIGLFKPVFIALFALFTFSTLVTADDKSLHSQVTVIYTLKAPPLVTGDPDRPGYTYELVEMMFRRAGLPYKIKIIPWKRAQRMAQQVPEAMIFPLTRTKTRNKLYNWSIPLHVAGAHFITTNGQQLTRKAAKAKIIGAQSGSSWQEWLLENDFKNIVSPPHTGAQMASLLCSGRIDAWFTTKRIAEAALKDRDCPAQTYSPVIQYFDIFLASNKQIPNRYITLLKQALRDIQSEGIQSQLRKKYYLF